MRYALVLPLALLGLAGCVVATPAPTPTTTTYVTPPPTTSYVAPTPGVTYVAPGAPVSTTTVVRTP